MSLSPTVSTRAPSPTRTVASGRSPGVQAASPGGQTVEITDSPLAAETAPPEAILTRSVAPMSLCASTRTPGVAALLLVASTVAPAPIPASVSASRVVLLPAAGKSASPPELESTFQSGRSRPLPASRPAGAPLFNVVLASSCTVPASISLSAPSAAVVVARAKFSVRAPLTPTSDALVLVIHASKLELCVAASFRPSNRDRRRVARLAGGLAAGRGARPAHGRGVVRRERHRDEPACARHAVGMVGGLAVGEHVQRASLDLDVVAQRGMAVGVRARACGIGADGDEARRHPGHVGELRVRVIRPYGGRIADLQGAVVANLRVHRSVVQGGRARCVRPHRAGRRQRRWRWRRHCVRRSLAAPGVRPA